MRPFFNNGNNLFKILNILEDSNDFSRYKDITDQTNLDRATVKKYLLELKNLFCKDFSDKQISLQIIEGQGVIYYRASSFNLDQVLEIINQASTERIIFEELFFNRSTSLQQFANDNFISTSTIRRKVSEISDTINDYHVEISLKEMEFTGKELNIRYMLFQYFWNIYGTSSWPFNSNLQEIYQTNLNLQKQLHITLSGDESDKLDFWLAINLQRDNRQHPINIDNFIEILIGTDMISTKDPFKFTVPTQIQNQTDEWLQCAQKYFKIDNFSDSFKIYLQQIQLANFYFADLPMLYDGDYLLHKIKHYPIYQFYIEKFLHQLNYSWFKMQPNLVLNYSILILSKLRNQLTIKPLKYFLYLDFNYATADIIAEKINNNFSVEYPIVNTTDIDQADFMITNLTNRTSLPNIYVNVPLSNNDYNNIHIMINKILKNK